MTGKRNDTHRDPYLCDVCGEEFADLDSFILHKKDMKITTSSYVISGKAYLLRRTTWMITLIMTNIICKEPQRL